LPDTVPDTGNPVGKSAWKWYNEKKHSRQGRPGLDTGKARREPDALAAPGKRIRIHEKARAGVWTGTGTGTSEPAFCL
jgi:hypothetical protein